MQDAVALLLVAIAGIVGFYACYVIKCKLGIDFFAQGGLHLPGPRTLWRRLMRVLTIGRQ
jgi:hypothetical protein